MHWRFLSMSCPLVLLLVGTHSSAQTLPGGSAKPRPEVQVPSDWIAGDTHIHMQKADPPTPCDPNDLACLNDACFPYDQIAAAALPGFDYTNPPCDPGEPWNSDHCLFSDDYTLDQIRCQMELEELQVGSVLLWKAFGTDFNDYYCEYAPLVTGQEDPASDSQHVLQVGVELSAYQSYAGRFGHIIGLGMDDAYFCPIEAYQAPILKYFQDGGGVTGYAHIRWPLSGHPFSDDACYTCPGCVPVSCMTDPACMSCTACPDSGPSAWPYFCPIDAAHGRIDFVETLKTQTTGGSSGTIPNYSELYYDLVGAGCDVSLAGGSDNVATGPFVGDCRTYVQIDLAPGEALTYDAWTAGLADGRTTIATGPDVFLDMSANTQPIGSDVPLESAAGEDDVLVLARLMYRGPVPFTTNIEFVKNGQVVDVGTPFTFLTAGWHTFAATIPFDESGWIAARHPLAHTGHTNVIVDGQPMLVEAALLDMLEYCNELRCKLDLIPAGGTGLGPLSWSFYREEIETYIDEAIAIYAARLNGEVEPVSSITHVTPCVEPIFTFPICP